jgi:glycosyltransferase involved in cell wall biosynthesis
MTEIVTGGGPKAGLSILIPCFEEEKNIHKLLTRLIAVMQQTNLPWEAVLVDDGSTDSTWVEIRKAAGSDDRIKGFRHDRNEGIPAAWQSALNQASMEWVLTMDADLQFAPEEIPSLIAKMNEGKFDLIQGKRIKRLDSRYRGALSAILSRFLKIVFHLPFEDMKSGFVLYKREVLQKVLQYRHPFRHYENWIIVAANSLGYKIAQVDITVYPRNAGTSYIKSTLVFAIRSLSDIPRLLRFRKK